MKKVLKSFFTTLVAFLIMVSMLTVAISAQKFDDTVDRLVKKVNGKIIREQSTIRGKATIVKSKDTKELYAVYKAKKKHYVDKVNKPEKFEKFGGGEVKVMKLRTNIKKNCTNAIGGFYAREGSRLDAEFLADVLGEKNNVRYDKEQQAYVIEAEVEELLEGEQNNKRLLGGKSKPAEDDATEAEAEIEADLENKQNEENSTTTKRPLSGNSEEADDFESQGEVTGDMEEKNTDTFVGSKDNSEEATEQEEINVAEKSDLDEETPDESGTTIESEANQDFSNNTTNDDMFGGDSFFKDFIKLFQTLMTLISKLFA